MAVVYNLNQNLKNTFALIGNPNAGKTTIFNSLTGSKAHVGNWPGVTVEKKEGILLEDKSVNIIDLPGTYSLGAYSEDELVARNYIIGEKPDVVIDVIDASNLKRNLYLAVQLMEMDANLVLALNMADEAKTNGIDINHSLLSDLLGIPVIPTVAIKNKGLKELISNAKKEIGKRKKSIKINYGAEIEQEIEKLTNLIEENPELTNIYSARWLAVKLLENDEELITKFKSTSGTEEILARYDQSIIDLEKIFGDDAETVIIEKRYGFIEGVVKKCVKTSKNIENSISFSDKVDSVVLNRFLGIPIFLAAMWAIFEFTFTLGDPLIGYIEDLFAWLGEVASAGISNSLLSSFIAEGLIGGLGSILVFLPNIFLLFFAISFLEDSGYMARAAYIMDRFMRALGLPGKAFIPLLMGFGCSVPAILATRTLESKNDRLTTILVAPLMSCGARLPVYALFVSAFFTKNQGLVMFSIYFVGIVLAIVMAKLFKTFLFPGETTPFVMELPPYRFPTLKSTFIHMWDRGSAFIKKAGTIIFGCVVLIWALASFPAGVEYASSESYMGIIGNIFAPVYAPLGFGTWEAASSLIFGLLAKEVVVVTLGTLYGTGEGAGLISAIGQNWTALGAYSFMLMTLIYVPCIAVLGAIKRETNSWKWPAFAIVYTMLLAWVVSFIVYQGGNLLGLG
ncbi:ferrous iron transport protein B [Desulfonispora thiosulfatigenes DSM 11270]|uniref:Ferrous iron transport protein B n=1 Tax=Desulfonispora thiosulfatigenes DSM 11270 TaxID=656914 RepID=A0A1W1VT84_DESTI|nr:ferrous iron transport protein B [Desulfonispora thiosulfatigenes]SMB96568.1 ferrous iron transport protein B [Desulfonispora thiosulfatigenes DSM 11270]